MNTDLMRVAEIIYFRGELVRILTEAKCDDSLSAFIATHMRVDYKPLGDNPIDDFTLTEFAKYYSNAILQFVGKRAVERAREIGGFAYFTETDRAEIIADLVNNYTITIVNVHVEDEAAAESMARLLDKTNIGYLIH